MAAADATGKLVVNMPITSRIRIVHDEPPINRTGKRPTAVFLIEKGARHLLHRPGGWKGRVSTTMIDQA